MARFGRRRGKAGGDEAAPQGAQPTGETQPAAGGAQPTTGGAQPTAGGAQPTQPPAKPATGSQPAVAGREPTIQERLEGQRSWLAQLDRRVGVRTYAGAAAVVIALAAAAVALVLVLQLDEESAKSTDIEQLREEIAGVEDSATQAAQEDVQSVTERLTELEAEIAEATSSQDSTDQEISVIEDDIQDLRDQIADLDQDSPSGSGGSGP
ncbi:MAG TPA: hypothetical protein VFY99_10755 [Solirubrobacterales bacterium]